MSKESTRRITLEEAYDAWDDTQKANEAFDLLRRAEKDFKIEDRWGRIGKMSLGKTEADKDLEHSQKLASLSADVELQQLTFAHYKDLPSINIGDAPSYEDLMGDSYEELVAEPQLPPDTTLGELLILDEYGLAPQLPDDHE